MNPREDYYRVLGVSPQADTETIERAYRRLARRYHPDLNPSPDATEQMARINEAYRVLRHTETRAQYDRMRQLLAHLPEPQAGPPWPQARGLQDWWEQVGAWKRENHPEVRALHQLRQYVAQLYRAWGGQVGEIRVHNRYEGDLSVRPPGQPPFTVRLVALPLVTPHWLHPMILAPSFPFQVVVSSGRFALEVYRVLETDGVKVLDRDALEQTYFQVFGSQPLLD